MRSKRTSERLSEPSPLSPQSFGRSLWAIAGRLVDDGANGGRYAVNPKTAKRLFRRACSLIGLPNRATASNCVAHYFGSVSDACKVSLGSIPGLAQPPAVRSVPIEEAVTEWRARQKIAAPVLTAVSATRLSTGAT